MTHEKASAIRECYELHEQGLSSYQISKLVQRPDKTIYGWLRNPEKFSPYIDEVAVDRALRGERSVFKNLSLYELKEFYERAGKISQEENERKGFGPTATNGYLVRLALDIGYEPKILRDLITRHRRNR